MKTFANLSPMTRRSALAAAMLLVLLASTATAWWLSRLTDPHRPGEAWYLILTPQGQPVGWCVVQRERDAAGSSGYEVVALSDRGGAAEVSTYARWELDARNESGRYMSAVPAFLRNGQPAVEWTFIHLEGQQVQITQEIADRARTFEPIEVGADYIAEGRLRPTIVEAARGQERFKGRIVVDRLGDLVPITITPEEPREFETRSGRAMLTPVRVEMQQAPEYRVYFVAGDGSIPRIEEYLGDQLRRVEEQVPFEAVRDVYPRAAAQRNQILGERDWPDDEFWGLFR